MRRLLLVLLVGAVVVLAIAAAGPVLPDGNFLRGFSDTLRGVGQSIARGFGGGYGELAR